jgi:hypothetical protein
MIGDAAARGKRHSTRAHGPEFKKKNSRGQSHKHVETSTGKNDTDSGGDVLTRKTSRAMHSGGPRAAGARMSDKQAPHKQREAKELKHVDQGDIINEWCRGKRGSYK